MQNTRHSPDLIERWRTLASAALDLFFPPVCVSCGQAGATLCPACAQKVQPVSGPLCNHCGRQQAQPSSRCTLCRSEQEPPTIMLRAAALHTDPLRRAIHALKYEDRPELASPLARYLTAAFATVCWQPYRATIDAVVAVPLHPERHAERGYNQSELLAAFFGRAVGLPCRPDWIERHASTRPQVGLNAEERRSNVAQAFAAAPAVAGRTILLIDDVYTTGSTLNACAAAARVAGAQAVFALALAIPSGGGIET